MMMMMMTKDDEIMDHDMHIIQIGWMMTRLARSLVSRLPTYQYLV